MNWLEWLQGFAGASVPEWIATLSGFLCVYLIIRRSIWCFAFGLVQVSIYSWIFYDVKLYSDMVLHLFYIGFQIYGWYIWRQSQNASGHIQVKKGSAREYSLCFCLIAIVTLTLGTFMHQYTQADYAYGDAFTTSASLVAQWLLTHKKLFNWLFWIVVDVVAITIYWQKGLYPTSVLYFCFLIMAIVGQWQWYGNWQQVNVTAKQTND
ncbi:nicotinamide riboside transporter PnuC [Paraglaciecola aquimarina]|uniref:Nicotinamide riboside transporter PnuC n=1 Tax=Paraglaciecola aquimarina TaxID=1235557 RepID=A0ABU3SRY3_9ALTE|nr:nicotinamide riboside transporter PnuC [Paraglaciecola aquimarina]MDU0352763.1 nicotinamide riboside transporter PnuC [Paraglaciecola aquimarina]